jgi:uncharacterized protein YggE
MRVPIAATTAALSLIFAPAALAATGGTTGATGTTGAGGPATLSVLGNGKTFVTPDVAQLNVNVSHTEPTSTLALSDTNAQTDQIVAAVKALGVPATGIQTQTVNVTRSVHRVGPKGHKHLVRSYNAQESLSVTTTTTLVGPVIDAATHNGASSVNGPNFSFSNPSAGVAAATNAAIADAQTRANAAAAQLGYVVTGVESINLDPGSGVVATPTAAGAAPVSTKSTPAPTPTTVNPGTQEVDAQVEVVYTIAPAS